MTARRLKIAPTLGLLVSVFSLVACSTGPSIAVLGAYFPDWMFCFLTGLLFSLFFHALINRYGAPQWWGPPAVTQFLMTAIFSLIAWLLFFRL